MFTTECQTTNGMAVVNLYIPSVQTEHNSPNGRRWQLFWKPNRSNMVRCDIDRLPLGPCTLGFFSFISPLSAVPPRLIVCECVLVMSTECLLSGCSPVDKGIKCQIKGMVLLLCWPTALVRRSICHSAPANCHRTASPL